MRRCHYTRYAATMPAMPMMMRHCRRHCLIRHEMPRLLSLATATLHAESCRACCYAEAAEPCRTLSCYYAAATPAFFRRYYAAYATADIACYAIVAMLYAATRLRT